MSKENLILIGAILIAGGLIAGGYFFPKSTNTYTTEVAQSPAGTTFTSAKIASIAMAPATASATTSSVYNGDASDRYIESFEVGCNTVGTSGAPVTGSLVTGVNEFSVAVGTTSASGANYAAGANLIRLPIATSSAFAYNQIGQTSTTSPNTISRVWAAGSYLTFSFNATNTAACVPTVHYLSS